MANKDLFVLVFAHEHEIEIEIEIVFELEVGIGILFELELDKAKLRSKSCQKTGGKKFKQEARMGWDKKMDSPKTTDGASSPVVQSELLCFSAIKHAFSGY